MPCATAAARSLAVKPSSRRQAVRDCLSPGSIARHISLWPTCVLFHQQTTDASGLCRVSSECTHYMSTCMCYGKTVCCSVACIQQYKLCHVCPCMLNKPCAVSTHYLHTCVWFCWAADWRRHFSAEGSQREQKGFCLLGATHSFWVASSPVE